MQHLVPVLWCPEDVVAMMKCRVTTLAVAHSESKAEANVRLKSEGFLPKWDPKLCADQLGLGDSLFHPVNGRPRQQPSAPMAHHYSLNDWQGGPLA